MSTNYKPRPGIPTEEEVPDNVWIWIWRRFHPFNWELERAEDIRCRLEMEDDPERILRNYLWLPKDALPIPEENNR